jgi:hypothetical protein
LSAAADHSKLWLASAAILATVGGARDRRAATAAVASIGLASAITNILAAAAIRSIAHRRFSA